MTSRYSFVYLFIYFISFYFGIQVICPKCSSHTLRLDFRPLRDSRVCDQCHRLLTQDTAVRVLDNRESKFQVTTHSTNGDRFTNSLGDCGTTEF